MCQNMLIPPKHQLQILTVGANLFLFSATTCCMRRHRESSRSELVFIGNRSPPAASSDPSDPSLSLIQPPLQDHELAAKGSAPIPTRQRARAFLRSPQTPGLLQRTQRPTSRHEGDGGAGVEVARG